MGTDQPFCGQFSAQRMKADRAVDAWQPDTGMLTFVDFLTASEQYIVKMGIILESNHNTTFDGLKSR